MASATTYEEIRTDIIFHTQLTPDQKEDVLDFVKDFRIEIGAQVIEKIKPDHIRKLIRCNLT